MKTTGNKQQVTEASEEDRKKYIDAWTKMMIEIWQDKMIRLKVMHTAALYRSLNGEIKANDGSYSISHRFLEYGIYQDIGTGRGFHAGHGGYLEVFDPVYREAHGLNKKRKWNGPKSKGSTSGKPRKPRKWFSVKYYASIMVIKEKMADMYAQDFTGIIVKAITFNEKYRATSLRDQLWG